MMTHSISCDSLAERQKQPVSNVTQSRLDHALVVYLIVTATDPDFNAFLPLAAGLLQTLLGGQHTDDNDPLDTPVLQAINGSRRGGTSGYNGVDDDGELRRAGGIWVRGRGRVVGKVVVVFYGLQRRLFAVQTEVVDSNGLGKQRSQGRDHGKAAAQDGDKTDGGGMGRCGGCGVGVAEGRCVLSRSAFNVRVHVVVCGAGRGLDRSGAGYSKRGEQPRVYGSNTGTIAAPDVWVWGATDSDTYRALVL